LVLSIEYYHCFEAKMVGGRGLELLNYTLSYELKTSRSRSIQYTHDCVIVSVYCLI
jgi:hypothetical protein